MNAATAIAYSDGIDAIEFRKGNSDVSAILPLRTKNLQYFLPKQMESSAQDLLTSVSSPAATNVDMNDQFRPDGLADSRTGPEKAKLQADGQDIQAKDIAARDEAVGDKMIEGITGDEHPNTEKRPNHHSGPISDASSLSLSSSIQASSGDSLRDELSWKSDGCLVQNDLSRERPILSDRNVKMPLAEERRQSANQSLRDHSSLKAPDDFHSEAEPESVAENLRAEVNLELTKHRIKTEMLHKEDSNRTGWEASMPPIESVAASEKKLFKDPMQPMEIFRAAEAVKESNSEYGLPAKSTDGLSASGSTLSEEEVNAEEMASPKASPLPSDLPSGEISSRDKPDARILLGKMEFILHKSYLKDTQSFMAEVAPARSSQEKNPVRFRTNLASEEDNAWPGKDSELRPSFNEIDQYPGEHANRARRAVPISSAQETIPYANPPNQDHLHADPIRSEFDESRPNGVHFKEHLQNIGNNTIYNTANRIFMHKKMHQIINLSHQLPQSSRIASCQIKSVEDKKYAELRPSQTREGLLPSGQTSTTTRIEDLHSSSDRNSSSESNGDNLFLPSYERSVMERTVPNIQSSEQGMKSRMNHFPARQQKNACTIGEIEESPERSERTGKQPYSPQFHVYESAENIAIAQKRHLSPIKTTRNSREASLERKAEEHRDEKTAPSVRVTIGRIEVRAAIAQEKPAEKARSKIHILSLDDYLRLRNGGQR